LAAVRTREDESMKIKTSIKAGPLGSCGGCKGTGGPYQIG
jgi:hypothetical protein